jgi:uncharacterized protein (TIGR03435 family)
MTRLGPLVILIAVTRLPLAAQHSSPAFEVASIKPGVPFPVGGFAPGSRLVCPITGCGGPGTGSPERITFTYISLKDLIGAAYNVQRHQVEAPGWLDSARFDIVATVPPGATRDEANLMLQNLLADRFRLKLHRSTRELPVFALIVARNGPKLKVSADDPNAPKPRGTLWSGGRKRLEFDSWTMASFARTLESDVGRPVIDMTGLEGTYDIRLEFASAPPIAFAPGSPDAQAAELFTALTEQLGLKLEHSRGPVDVLVIDSVEQPTPD